jgi:hypothetical protein
MSRGGARIGAGRKPKYIESLGDIHVQAIARLSRIATAASSLSRRASAACSALPSGDLTPRSLAERVAGLARLEAEIAAERTALLALLRAEPSASASEASPGLFDDPHESGGAA